MFYKNLKLKRERVKSKFSFTWLSQSQVRKKLKHKTNFGVSLYSKRGFTLIEFLIVIAIIGLLSSVVLASLNSARRKARDARRLSDLNQISLALEMYYDGNNRYPGVFNTFYWISDNNYNEGLPCSATIGLKSWLPNVCSVIDPLNNPYGYAQRNSNNDGQAYKLCAYFELSNNQGAVFTYGFGGTPVSGCYERKN